MEKNKKKIDKKNNKFSTIDLIGKDSGMVCGPDGCSLTDHFDWAKEDKEKNK
ncbi:MAG: hypothetical protein K2O64_00830 [Lactobacillus sp.]|nr:hypothetical protein [Lactobacillus sp.]